MGVLHQEISVTTHSGESMPAAFAWRERRYRIARVLECWRLIGNWWDGEGERTFFRVECGSRAIFEIHFDTRARRWFVSRVED